MPRERRLEYGYVSSTAPMLQIYLSFISCVIAALFNAASGNPFGPPLKLLFIQSCNKDAVFQWKLMETGVETPINCSIYYKLSGSDDPYSVLQFKFSDTSLTLTGLEKNSTYEASVLCGESPKSDPLSFTVGDLCPHKIQASTEGPEVTMKERQIFSSSITDIVLGIVFGLVAVIIVVVAIYYQYRKCLRRRRLQRYLNTPHTDPFESLQDHMEDQS